MRQRSKLIRVSAPHILLGLAVVAAVVACGAPEPAPAQVEQPAATPAAAARAPDSALAAVLQAGEQQTLARLPSGAGREVVSKSCLTCHDAAIIEMQRKNRERWSRSVRRMVDWGAQLSAEQEDVVVDYLVEHFGTDQDATP